MQESEGGTKHDFKLDFATEKEAEQFASDMDWRYVDENQFEGRLAVEEMQPQKNRQSKTVTRKKWRLKASPMQSANILASRLEKIALAILPVGVKARS